VEREPEVFQLIEEPYWVTEPVTATLLPDYGRLIDRLLPATAQEHRRRRRLNERTYEMVVRNAEIAVGNTTRIGRNIQRGQSPF
jgi:hypothetical protein